MKTNKYKLYIGANNITGAVDHINAKRILSKYAQGFNIVDCVGFWDSSEENCITAELIATDTQIINDKTIKELKLELERELKQFLVLTTCEEINLIE